MEKQTNKKEQKRKRISIYLSNYLPTYLSIYHQNEQQHPIHSLLYVASTVQLQCSCAVNNLISSRWLGSSLSLGNFASGISQSGTHFAHLSACLLQETCMSCPSPSWDSSCLYCVTYLCLHSNSSAVLLIH